MSGRTLQVGQVWEHWALRTRIRIDSIGTDVLCSTADGIGVTTHGHAALSVNTVLGDYFYLGSLNEGE